MCKYSEYTHEEINHKGLKMSKNEKTNMAFLILMMPIMYLTDLTYGGAHERQLLGHLMATYQKYERPVSNESSPMQLLFTLSLQQIIDLDERNQLLKTNLWLDYSWTDVNLLWNTV